MTNGIFSPFGKNTNIKTMRSIRVYAHWKGECRDEEYPTRSNGRHSSYLQTTPDASVGTCIYMTFLVLDISLSSP